MILSPPPASLAASFLPPDDPLRVKLHDEVHARPSALIGLPTLVTYVAVLNDGVSRDAEFEHLCRLPGQQDLVSDDLQRNFLRLALGANSLKWERHSEFTRYSIVQPLPAGAGPGGRLPVLLDGLAVEAAWLRGIPGRTVAAIQLAMVVGELGDAQAVLASARRWFGDTAVVASRMGASAVGGGHAPDGHSCAVTDFQLGDDGFERMLVIAAPDTTDSRAGRIAQRLLEIETYRLMALRGLPVAKSLAPMLAEAEAELAAITARLEGTQISEQQLLDTLIALAARVERATAEHMYRFSATQAYDALVRQRIAELREKAIPGAQTIGEFMQRRLSPAMATVAATAQRLGACRNASSVPARCCARGSTSSPRRRTSNCWPSSRAARSCNCACRARSKACRSPPSRTTWSACCCTAARQPRPPACRSIRRWRPGH